MPHRPHFFIFILIISGLFIAPAVAQSSLEIEYQLSHRHAPDKGKPTVTFQANQTLREVTITFERSGDHRQVETFDQLSSAQPAVVEVDQPVGRFSYDISVEGTTVSGDRQSIAFRFDIAVVEGLEVEVLRDEIDFDAGLVPIEVNKAVDSIALEVYDRNGEQTVSETTSLAGRSGRIDVRWEPQGEVGGLRMTIDDGEGQTAERILRPIWIDVAAQIVNFETGSADLQPQGIATLERTRRTIEENLRGVDDERRGDMRLYIAGYTDTVGAASHNLRLSQARARAIGAWFRNHDIDIPIFYQGFGQEVLAVDTPDNTEEERNRRALFILGNAPPRQSDDIPRSNWNRLD